MNMVSTRAVKLKFFEGERVLCYEPDPTKAKVLYDSKVLDVISNKDPRGKKLTEYLIHFQGWNSSWDRCVGEEFVLKDTPENRQLQKDLAEKSQLHIGAYLYRKERKKSRKSSISAPSATTNAPSSEDGSSGSPARIDTEPSSTSDDSSMEEDPVRIELGPDVREILERDHAAIAKSKLARLPAEPNIVTILEMFWRRYATGQMCGLHDKPNARQRQAGGHNRARIEEVQKNLALCKEFVDGIRIYFDTISMEHLLYRSERGQIKTQLAVYQPTTSSTSKTEPDRSKPDNFHACHHGANRNGAAPAAGGGSQRKRTLRSSNNQQRSQEVVIAPANGNDVGPTAEATNNGGPLEKVLAWQLLPEYVYHQQPPPPSLVYGATHLLRLFVKLPQFLAASSITEAKLKIVLSNVELLLE